LCRRPPRPDSSRTPIEAGFSRREADLADPAHGGVPPIGAQALAGCDFSIIPGRLYLIDLPARPALPTAVIFNGQLAPEAVFGV